MERYDLVQLQAIVAYTLINVIVAVAAGLKLGDFQISKLGEFLYRKLLPYVLTYLGAGLVVGVAGLEGLTSLAFLAIMALLTGDLTDSLYRLGLNWIPKSAIKPETLVFKPKPETTEIKPKI